MTQDNVDAITNDQQAIDAEQAAVEATPQYVSVEAYNALQSQVRGLQGTLDRTTAQFNSQLNAMSQAREVEARIAGLEQRAAQATDPDVQALYADRISELRSTAPQVPSVEPPAQSVGVSAVTEEGKALLSSIDIDPALPGIDWSLISTDQTAWMKSAVAAKASAVQQVAQRTAAPTPINGNPPVERSGSAANGVYRTMDELNTAFIEGRVDRTQYQNLEQQFRR